MLRSFLAPCLCALLLTSCISVSQTTVRAPGGGAASTSFAEIIPQPVSAVETDGVFRLGPAAAIYVEPGNAEVRRIGEYLAARLRPATGYAWPVSAARAPGMGHLTLTTAGADAALGEEGYALTITTDGVVLSAYRPAGLFRGVQTLRQLLPPAIERQTPSAGPWVLPTGTIRDHPRFAWRGAMLDVARHFFAPADVKQFIDALAYYKLNHLHLHLSDDQGWRIAIASWPNLTAHGGSTAVGGGPGGYYTRDEYADLVAYAASRYVTVVPEIDMPGHTNAALASYAELNCDGVAPALYTGIEVGFSSLCVDKEVTYTFVADVLGELAALTPGPYLHIGGDETHATAPADYRRFIERVLTIVRARGKQAVGWEEIAHTSLPPGTLVQHWDSDSLAQVAVRKGARLIFSPASRAYLDMKYDATTRLGLQWAGFTDVEDAYAWDPATQVSGVSERDIAGIEAPLWTETLQTLADVEQMVFPRLPGLAEIGWSPAAGRTWAAYRTRLATHGPRLSAMGIDFFRHPSVDWR